MLVGTLGLGTDATDCGRQVRAVRGDVLDPARLARRAQPGGAWAATTDEVSRLLIPLLQAR